MTKTYNASILGMAEQIKSKLIEKVENLQEDTNVVKWNAENTTKEVKVRTISTYITPTVDGTIELEERDILVIATILNKEIFVAFPSLKSIYDYLLKIARLMIKLNIPLTWFIPKGAKITQNYNQSVVYKVPLTFGEENKSLILREWNDKVDNFKQVQAIIPNIIHSLDATHLVNIVNSASDIDLGPVITVHDCFGTHPNKMSDLVYLVKKEFVLLYSQEEFLVKFHERIMQSIEDNGYVTRVNRKNISQVRIGEKWNNIPVLPKMGKLDLQAISRARYMVS